MVFSIFTSLEVTHDKKEQMLGTSSEQLFEDGLLVGFVLLLIYTIAAAIIEAKRVTEVKGIHESGVAIVLGLITSFIFYWANNFKIQGTFGFNESIFFTLILPPIIFAAGYNLKRRRFFSNFGGIALFGVLGTIFTFFSIAGLNIWINQYPETTLLVYNRVGDKWEWSHVEFNVRQILLMSSLVCSSDTVAALTIVKYNEQPKLFSLIFGEGILNDAVSIILFKTVLTYTLPDSKFEASTPFIIILRFLLLALASVAIGIVMGLLCSFMLKKFRFLTHQPVHETAAVFFFGFISYMVSELLDQSGIITLLICGVVLAHYAWYNLSPQAKHGTRQVWLKFSLAFQMIGFGCEAFIFAYLGLVFFNYQQKAWSFTLIAFELPIVCLGRIIGTFGLLTLIRIICCKKFFLNFGELTFVWFAGLIRGAIAFGLVLRLDQEKDIPEQIRDIIITTALVLVIFTTLVFGSVMPLLSKCLLPKKGAKRKEVTPRGSVGSNLSNTRFTAKNTLNPMKTSKLSNETGLLPGESIHQPFLHPNMQRNNSQIPVKDKKGTCKFYWKRFDHGIMKPIFIHRFDELDQKKDLAFFDGFMKEGNQWAKQYREHGELNRVNVKRRHSVISRSSEDDEQDEEEAMDTLKTEQAKLNERLTFKKTDFDRGRATDFDRLRTGDFPRLEEAKVPDSDPVKFSVNQSQPSFGDKPPVRTMPQEMIRSFEAKFKEDDELDNENERK